MAFQQLYYTSCEHGLLGYGGFQFNAATPGVSPAVLREVEELTAYEPPRSMPANPGPGELAGYPVAFSHTPGGEGASITARVVFAGADYSGRPGNYFAHALVAESADDFGPLLPVELWDAPFWQASPVRSNELPPLPGPPPRGSLDLAGAAEFIARRDPAVLPVLLTAAGEAVAAGTPLLLAGRDCQENAAWIGAICYFLGEDLARRVSFTTYSHRPAYSRHQLIGVLSSDLGSAGDGFRRYDAATGELPDVAVHPLAALLARVGLRQAQALWQQAAALSSGAAARFDAWYPLVAAAAVVAGLPLDEQDEVAVEGWLSGTADLPAGARLVLEQLAGRLGQAVPDRRIAALQPVAVRLRSTVATDQLELSLAERAFARLERGEPPGTPVRLTSQPAQAMAISRTVSALHSLPPESVLRVLEWTGGADVPVPGAELRRYGAILDPYIDRDLLARILDGQPEITAGLIGKAATAHDDFARELFRSGIIGREAVASNPRLAELWVRTARERGELPPLQALRDIREARHARGARLDAGLLDELWPGGCPTGDLVRMLPLAGQADLKGWLVDRIVKALETGSADGQMELARALGKHPNIRDSLPASLSAVTTTLAKFDDQLSSAASKVARGDVRALRELYRSYPRADQQAKSLLERRLPAILGAAEPLGLALRDCPKPVRKEFCNQLHIRLNVFNADSPLGARVFVAVCDLRDHGDEAVAHDLQRELDQVLDWKHGPRRALRKELDKDLAEAFDQWWEERHGGALVKIRGLLRSRREGGK